MCYLHVINNPPVKDGSKYLYKKGCNYTNIDAVEKVIRYITRTNGTNSPADLISWGSPNTSVWNGVDGVITDILKTQNIFDIKRRNGRRIFHEVLQMQEFHRADDCNRFDLLNQAAMECCLLYDHLGFQAVYGIHHNEDNSYGHILHIHFAVNTISYKDGHKWHSDNADHARRSWYFYEVCNAILNEYWDTSLCSDRYVWVPLNSYQKDVLHIDIHIYTDTPHPPMWNLIRNYKCFGFASK